MVDTKGIVEAFQFRSLWNLLRYLNHHFSNNSTKWQTVMVDTKGIGEAFQSHSLWNLLSHVYHIDFTL